MLKVNDDLISGVYVAVIGIPVGTINKQEFLRQMILKFYQ